MSGFLDPSVLVRYLMDDPPHMAERAGKIIDSVSELRLTGVVILEASFALTSIYGVPREAVVDSLVAFVQKENVVPHGLDQDLLLQALLMCRPSGRISFGDALVWAAARSAGSRVVYSFDQRFPDFGLEVLGRA